jgi:GNAT superfamily N-acetyltransferase
VTDGETVTSDAVLATISDLGKYDDDDAVRAFHRTMLVPNFLADEVLSVEHLVEGVRNGDKRVLVASGPDGAFLAGAVGEWYPDSRVQLLAYLVVRPELRGQGLGSRILSAALEQWTAALEPLLVVGEVEDPRHFQDTGLGDVVARVRLYERLGVRALPVPYAQPALVPGGSRVPGLMLMVFSSHDDARLPSGNVDSALVERFLTEYYTAVEGTLSPGDTQVEAMRAACRTEGGLPLLLACELPEFFPQEAQEKD